MGKASSLTPFSLQHSLYVVDDKTMQNRALAQGRDSALKETELSGTERAAMLLIILGQENSASILPKLTEPHIEALTLQIGRTPTVPTEIRLRILREFRDLLQAKQYITQGGLDYAKSILLKAMEEPDADRLISRVRRIIEGDPFEFMEQAHPSNLIEVLRQEHPQTIALILGHLGPDQASAVLQGFSPEMRLDIIKRIAAMEQIDSQVLNLLDKSLHEKLSSMLSPTGDRVGGAEKVAEILNLVDSTSEKQIMSGLATDNPELAEEVQMLMFTFEDLESLDPRGLQKILGQTQTADIVLALKAAPDSLKEKFLNCVSARNSEAIQDEIEVMGRVPLKDVEEAQKKILEIARNLEEAGEIVIIRGGGTDSQYI